MEPNQKGKQVLLGDILVKCPAMVFLVLVGI